MCSCTTDEPTALPIETAYECEFLDAQDKGTRHMGIDLLDVIDTETFDRNLGLPTESGMDFITLHTTWAGLEASPQTYTDPFNAIVWL